MGEQVKKTASRFFQEQDRLRGGPDPDLCAEGYTAYLASFPPMDLQSHEGFSAAFYAAFPDLSHGIEDVVVEGDRAVVSFRMTGTNTGSFMGMPPSDQRIDVGGLALMKMTAGKIIELRGQFDQLGLMQQIGALPRE